MIINLYDVVALENVGTEHSKRITKAILAETEAKALKIFYRYHPLAKYAKANLKQGIKVDYLK